MSRQQIEEIVESLQNLPEASQQQVRDFIAGLQDYTPSTAVSKAALPNGLEWDRGLLVYTGSILVEDAIKYEREYHLDDLIRKAIG